MMFRSVRSLQPRLSVAFFSSNITPTNTAQTVPAPQFEDAFADEYKTFPLEKYADVLVYPELAEPTASISESPLGWGPEKDKYEAVIFKPSRIVTQNHHGEPSHWQMRFNLQKQWQNNLMGWQSGTGVTEQLTENLKFPSRNHAIAYAHRSGIKFTVRDPVERKKTKPKSYADNFTKYDVTGEW